MIKYFFSQLFWVIRRFGKLFLILFAFLILFVLLRSLTAVIFVSLIIVVLIAMFTDMILPKMKYERTVRKYGYSQKLIDECKYIVSKRKSTSRWVKAMSNLSCLYSRMRRFAEAAECIDEMKNRISQMNATDALQELHYRESRLHYATAGAFLSAQIDDSANFRLSFDELSASGEKIYSPKRAPLFLGYYYAMNDYYNENYHESIKHLLSMSKLDFYDIPEMFLLLARNYMALGDTTNARKNLELCVKNSRIPFVTETAEKYLLRL